LHPTSCIPGFWQACDAIIERFHALPMLAPERDDHIQAAALRNELTLLTTDGDFTRIAASTRLRVWAGRPH